MDPHPLAMGLRDEEKLCLQLSQRSVASPFPVLAPLFYTQLQPVLRCPAQIQGHRNWLGSLLGTQIIVIEQQTVRFVLNVLQLDGLRQTTRGLSRTNIGDSCIIFHVSSPIPTCAGRSTSINIFALSRSGGSPFALWHHWSHT